MLTGLLLGQDVLTLKNGELYTGTFYGKVGKDIVFMVEGETSTKKFSINDVEIIKIKSGELSYPFDVPKIANDAKKNSLTLEEEEYQKLSTKEKAIYDAKTNGIFGKISIPKSLTSQDSKMLYEEVYFNKISQRKTRLILGSVAVTVGVAYVIYLRLMNLSMDFGGDARIITEGTISCGDWGLY